VGEGKGNQITIIYIKTKNKKKKKKKQMRHTTLKFATACKAPSLFITWIASIQTNISLVSIGREALFD
jgi:hypothetical protein